MRRLNELAIMNIIIHLIIFTATTILLPINLSSTAVVHGSIVSGKHRNSNYYVVNAFPNESKEEIAQDASNANKGKVAGNYDPISVNHVSSNGTKSHLKQGEDVSIWAVLVAGSNGYYNYRHQVGIHFSGMNNFI